MASVEYGYVNTVNREAGTVTVIQPDRNQNITGEMALFSHYGEFKAPEVGDLVVLVRWGSTSSEGVVLGGWWSEGNPPPEGYGFYKDTGNGTAISEKGGELSLKDSGGAISIKALIETLEDHEKRITKLGG